jgi:hypothetical protein
MGNKSFSEYYAEALAAQPVSPAQQPTVAPPKFAGTSKQNPETKPFNFIDWGMDILSRPLYAVTETADSIIDSAEEAPEIRAKFDKGDVGGAVGQIASGIGRGLTAGARGFFSNDEDDKNYTNELIERGTDVVGEQVDPDYEDVDDNVNPVLKAVLGFAGDVALDPLTWIPGGVVASLGKKGIAGIKSGKEAVDTFQQARKGDGAAEAVQPQAERPAVREAEEADIDAMASMPEPVAPPKREIPPPTEIESEIEAALQAFVKTPEQQVAKDLVPDAPVTATRIADDLTSDVPTPKIEQPGIDDLVRAVDEARAMVTTTKAGKPNKNSIKAALRELEKNPQMKELLDVAHVDDDGTEFLGRSWVEDVFNGLDDDYVHLRSMFEDGLAAVRPAAEVAEEAVDALPAPTAAASAPPAAPRNRTAALSAFNAGIRAQRMSSGGDIRPESFGEYADAFDAGLSAGAASGAKLSRSESNAMFDDWFGAGDEAPAPATAVDEGPVTVREAVDEVQAEAPPRESLQERAESTEEFAATQRLLEAIGPRTAEGPTFGDFILSQARDPRLGKMPAANVDGVTYRWQDIPKVWKQANHDTEAFRELEKQLLQSWKRKSAAAKGQATKWNKLPMAERYSQIIKTEDGRALAERALGEGLTNRFDKITNADKFAALMAEIGAVTSRVLNLDEITKESIKFDTTRAALKRFGIDDDELPVEAVSPTSHVTEAVGAAQEAADLTRPVPRTSATESVVESMTVPEGGKTLAERTERLTPAQQDVSRVVTDVIGQDVFGIGLPKGRKRPYKTKHGAARTDKEYGKGFAVWEGRINGPTQHNLANRLLSSLSDTLKGWRDPKGNLLNAGEAYATKKKQLYMERSEIAHKLLDREGIAMHLGIREDDVMLSDYQLRQVLDLVDPKVSTMLLYNVPTGVPISNLYEAVSAMLRGADDDALREILVKTDTVYNEGGTYINPLAKGDSKATRRYGHRIFPKGPPEAPAGAKWVKNPKAKNGYYLQFDATVLREATLRLLQQAKPRLQELAQKNANARKVRIDTETSELTAAERAYLEEIVTDPAKMGAAIRATAEPEVTVQKMAQDAGATQESVTLASINAVTDIPVPDKIVSTGAAEAADKVKASGDPQSAKATAQKTQERLIDDSAEEMLQRQQEALANAGKLTDDELRAAGVADATADISRQVDEQIDISLAHAANPNINGLLQRMGKALKANWGFERISRFRHSAEVASAMRRTAFIEQIGKLVTKHGGVVKGATSTTNSLTLKAAWNSLRTGAPIDNPAINAARADLEQIFGQLFDTTRQESILGNVFFRNPVSVDHVNGELRAVGLRDAHGQEIIFDIAAADAKSKANGTDLMTEVIEQWRTWDIADPAEALLKLFAASERVSTRAIIGQNFNKFTAENGLFSTTPKPGFAQPMASGKSIFISMLKQDGYYDKEILKELSRLEAFMGASRSFDGGIGRFIHGFFDPMQQSWKYGMTVVRPGHHVRNLVGDASMTYLAEGMRFAKKSNTDAIKVLTAMHDKYDGFSFNRAMEGLGLPTVPGSSDVLYTGRNGRKFTVGQVYEAYYTRGLQNSYRHSEDVLDEGLAPDGFARLMNRISLRGGKVEHVAGSVSQARDHYARMQHFLQYIYKAEKDGRGFANVEELFDAAAHQVKKYHPDGSMLTPFESKYMRRIIPFYSWLRGALPAIVEASALKPSRITVFPKASMNLAIAMGVNPDSLANPFPEDQLFPSFLTDQVFGPQFGNARDGYFGFSPGIAGVDVANQFLAGKPGEATLRGLAGSTSPLFRIPAELLSGGSWGTGARINDASDYIDSTLPGVNYISNISGYSVTGSIVGGITGQGMDEQLQVARGNKTDTDKMLSMLNWLTGASVQNQSRPNYINYAEIEKRNAAAQSGEEVRNAF